MKISTSEIQRLFKDGFRNYIIARRYFNSDILEDIYIELTKTNRYKVRVVYNDYQKRVKHILQLVMMVVSLIMSVIVFIVVKLPLVLILVRHYYTYQKIRLLNFLFINLLHKND